MKSCDDVMEELTARLADGATADQARSPEVAEHLAGCASCRREAEELTRLWAGLAALETEAPVDELRPRFDAMLHAFRAGMEGAGAAARAGEAPGAPRTGRRPRWLAALLPGSGAPAPAWRLVPVAAALLVGLGLGTLVGSRRGADVESLRSEVHSLNEMVALSLLDQPSAVDRLRGVSYGGRLQRPDRPVVTALVHTATADPNVNVRLAALDALAPVASEPPVEMALIRTLPHQDSPMVQIALVDLLLDHDGARARRAVEALADDPAVLPEVRQHARRRLGTSV